MPVRVAGTAEFTLLWNRGEVTEKANKGLRTCIGCGTQSSKTTLYRVVRQPSGSIAFDATGRMNGRGAYVCSRECFQKASQGKLQRALKCAVSTEETARIAEELDEALESAIAR